MTWCWFLTCGSFDQQAIVWEKDSGNIVKRFIEDQSDSPFIFRDSDQQIHSGAFSPDGTQVLLGLKTGSSKLYRFTDGEFIQRFQVRRDSQPLWAERAAFEAGSPTLTAPWGLGARPITGTLVCTGACSDEVANIHAILPSTTERDAYSATLLGEVLICRYLGYSAEAAKQFFVSVWARWSARGSGPTAAVPRIWAT